MSGRALVGGLLATTTGAGRWQTRPGRASLHRPPLMIALGLYFWRAGGMASCCSAHPVRQFWPLINRWQAVSPVYISLAGLPFGMVWGWLPLRPVYSMLTGALPQAPRSGRALIMLFSASAPCRPCLRLGLADRLRYWLTLQPAPLGAPAAYCLRDPHLLDRDGVLLKPYPKRMRWW